MILIFNSLHFFLQFLDLQLSVFFLKIFKFLIFFVFLKLLSRIFAFWGSEWFWFGLVSECFFVICC